MNSKRIHLHRQATEDYFRNRDKSFCWVVQNSSFGWEEIKTSVQQQAHKRRNLDYKFACCWSFNYPSLILRVANTKLIVFAVFPFREGDFWFAWMICLLCHLFGLQPAVKENRLRSGYKRLCVDLSDWTIQYLALEHSISRKYLKLFSRSLCFDLFPVERKIPIYLAPSLLPAFRPFWAMLALPGEDNYSIIPSKKQPI